MRVQINFHFFLKTSLINVFFHKILIFFLIFQTIRIFQNVDVIFSKKNNFQVFHKDQQKDIDRARLKPHLKLQGNNFSF